MTHSYEISYGNSSTSCLVRVTINRTKVKEGEGVQSQILKQIDQDILSLKNDAKFIILKNSR